MRKVFVKLLCLLVAIITATSFVACEDVTDSGSNNKKYVVVSDDCTVLNEFGFWHNQTLNNYCEHKGVDFGAEVGAKVMAYANGTVEKINTGNLLLGNEITIDHGQGFKTIYRFVDVVQGLKVDDKVSKGQTIATVAEANGEEYKEGAHLHFETWLNDKAINPFSLLNNKESKYVVISEDCTVLSKFGFWHNQTLNNYCEHTGVDFGAEVGTKVMAYANGTVEKINTGDPLLGNEITIDHGQGFKTVYRFVDVVQGLKVGDNVIKGQTIATVAEANGEEYKEGAHLHFETWLNGTAVNPETYVNLD